MQFSKIKSTLCTLKIVLHKVKWINLNKYHQAYLWIILMFSCLFTNYTEGSIGIDNYPRFPMGLSSFDGFQKGTEIGFIQ